MLHGVRGEDDDRPSLAVRFVASKHQQVQICESWTSAGAPAGRCKPSFEAPTTERRLSAGAGPFVAELWTELRTSDDG